MQRARGLDVVTVGQIVASVALACCVAVYGDAAEKVVDPKKLKAEGDRAFRNEKYSEVRRNPKPAPPRQLPHRC